jgi:proteic killer suppression protein
MQVEFRTKKLEKQYRDSKQAIREYGEAVAKRYVQRINIIKSATDIEELERLPGLNCHPLKGNRAGDWSITLINRMRLIFTLKGDKLEVVRIKEVSKHYGD